MKNKVQWLVVLVLGIWGTIAYKIFQSRDTEDMPESTHVVEHVNNSAETRDDYPLLLRYRDPFLDGKPKPKVASQAKKPAAKKDKLIDTSLNIIVPWEKIEYMGSIYNATRKITLATIRIDGAEHMAKQGEFVAGFKIENVTNDSIQLSFGLQTKYVGKKNK